MRGLRRSEFGVRSGLAAGKIAVCAAVLAVTAVRGFAVCAGDCGGDGQVTVEEIVLGVNIALGTTPPDRCTALDGNADQQVTVEEIIRAVNGALNGCPPEGFVGNYSATVSFDATHGGLLNLAVAEDGSVGGTMLITAAAPRAVSINFPVGNVSVVLTGQVYDEATGGFEVEGSFVDAGGQTVQVVVSGNLPGPTGSAPVNVYLGDDPNNVYPATLTAGMLITPTPAPTPTPPPAAGSQRVVYNGGVVDPELYIVNVDGSAKRALTAGAGVEYKPAWSPNGSKVAFSGAVQTGYGITVVNVDGSGRAALTEEDSPLNSDPAWSPDGSRISFTSGGGDHIEIINADGSGRTRVVSQLQGERYGHMSWSPDGTRIAFESSRDNGSVSGNLDALEIWVMNADGTDLRRLTTNAYPDQYPAWSPNGAKILFSSKPTGQGENLYLMNPDGSGVTRLTNEFFGAASPAWGRDGAKLAYTTLLGIKVANPDGSAAVTVPNTSFIQEFDFR